MSRYVTLRSRKAVLLASFLSVCVAVAGCSPSQGGGGTYLGVTERPGLAKPSIVLTDTSGQPYDLRQRTEGHVTLVYFGYTHCPDVCPTQMADIAVALQRIARSVSGSVITVFVTTDPDRDTASVLRSWLDNFSSTFVGLTGTPAQIQAAETAFGLPASVVQSVGGGDYTVAHSAQVFAFTRDNLAHLVYPAGVGVAAYAHDLPLLAQGWRNQ